MERLATRLAEAGHGDIAVIAGFLDRADPPVERLGSPKGSPQNAVAVLYDGRIAVRQAKHHLWNYGVGDEIRNFVPGDTINIVQVRGVDVAIAICEDLWQDGPSEAADAAEAGLLIVPNGSPYERNKDDVRLELCSRRAREGVCALAYVNLVGGQDELVFDGDSLVVDSAGELVARAKQFVPELLVVDLDLPAATEAMPDPDRSFSGLSVPPDGALVGAGPVVRRRGGRGRATARVPGGGLPRPRPRSARLCPQERLPDRPDGSVGRHRLDAGRHHRLRRARPGERLRSLQPERVVDGALPDRRGRARASYRPPARHRADRSRWWTRSGPR